MKLLPVVFAAASTLLVSATFADEGMWTFDNFPAAAVRQKYAVEIDKAWLDRVQRAAVRLSSGCSASIVTADGLVLTNDHCVRDCAQALSSAGQDYARDGFSATARTQERLCPGMQAEILSSITDDTTRITAAVKGKTGEAFVKARDAEIAAVEKAGCEGRESQYRCQVISLYQGGQYKLYTYRKYSDVRLVFAPEEQTAFFGGDPDNFNFPRYDLDFSIVRLYENGQPMKTPDHLTWRTTAPRDGEPVFVAGNPGSTERLLTAAQLTFIRDVSLPTTLLLYSELRGRLLRFGEESTERARTADHVLFSLENSFKAFSGQLKALTDPTLIVAKRQADESLQMQVKKRPELSKELGDPWGRISQVQQVRAALYLPYTFTEARAGLGSDLFGYARALVRAAAERTKPNGDRLREFSDTRLPLLQKSVLDARPVYPELEQATLEFWLSKLREYLTVDDPRTKIFLGKDSPEQLSARLAKSGLGNLALRKKLWEGGEAAILASDDPMIQFVLATDPASRAVRTEYETRVVGPTDMATEQIARARFAIYGTSVYPDATFSLRLSFGKVTGWTDNGKTVGPFTRFAGLWQRATGQPPFNLAPRWVDSAGKVDPNMVFDFVSDNDIIGGNSGSPIIDAQGHVIGAIFDGNIESLGGDFGFNEKVNRAVAVSTAAITEALEKIYGNQALVADLQSQ
ncbi:MAG TPA: S46 family peptidase [Steroidobacteraceae bacterium]|nr:S46 family peptidase [Steroidobacteraceae bacterium]